LFSLKTGQEKRKVYPLLCRLLNPIARLLEQRRGQKQPSIAIASPKCQEANLKKKAEIAGVGFGCSKIYGNFANKIHA